MDALGAFWGGTHWQGQGIPTLSLSSTHMQSCLLGDPETNLSKGPFLELQAGPVTASKKPTEAGSQENSLFGACGFVPTSRAKMMTPSLWLEAVW